MTQVATGYGAPANSSALPQLHHLDSSLGTQTIDVIQLPWYGETGSEVGVYYCIEFGGTHFRILRVELTGNGKAEIHQKKMNMKETLNNRYAMGLLDPNMSATDLFDYFAKMLKEMMMEHRDHLKQESIGIRLTFLYKVDSRTYTLSPYSKEYDANAMDVGMLLKQALEKHSINCHISSVLHDTDEEIRKFHQMGHVSDIRSTGVSVPHMATAYQQTSFPQAYIGTSPQSYGASMQRTADQTYSESQYARAGSSKVMQGNPTHRLNMESRAHGMVDVSHKKMDEAYAREVTLMMSQSGINSTEMVIEKATSYVEVPIVEFVEKKLPKKIVVEREQVVPKREVEYVEKIVYVPEVQVVEKVQEVEQIEYVTKQIPIKQYVDVPKEVIRTVPKIEVRQVEKVVEKPYVENVPRPYVIEQEIYLPQFQDKLAMVAVSQIAQSEIVASNEELECDVRKYVPYLVPVDVFVPRPVNVELIATGKRLWEDHRIVELPAAHFNSLLQVLNQKLVSSQEFQKYLPYMMEVSGEVTLLAERLNNPLILQEGDVNEQLRAMIRTYLPSHLNSFNVRCQELIQRLKEECHQMVQSGQKFDLSNSLTAQQGRSPYSNVQALRA